MIMRILRWAARLGLWMLACWGAFASASYGAAHLLQQRHAPDRSTLRVIGTSIERIASLEIDERSTLRELVVPENLVRMVKIPVKDQLRIHIAVDYGEAMPAVEYRFDSGVFRRQLCQLTIVIDRAGAELLCLRYVGS
jgi:hypothetical protein